MASITRGVAKNTGDDVLHITIPRGVSDGNMHNIDMSAGKPSLVERTRLERARELVRHAKRKAVYTMAAGIVLAGSLASGATGYSQERSAYSKAATTVVETSKPITMADVMHPHRFMVEEVLLLQKGSTEISVTAKVQDLGPNKYFFFAVPAFTENGSYKVGILSEGTKAAIVVSARNLDGVIITDGGKPIIINIEPLKDGDTIKFDLKLADGKFTSTVTNMETGKAHTGSCPDNSKKFVFPKEPIRLIDGSTGLTGVELYEFSPEADASRGSKVDIPEAHVTFTFDKDALKGGAVIYMTIHGVQNSGMAEYFKPKGNAPEVIYDKNVGPNGPSVTLGKDTFGAGHPKTDNFDMH
jgi:FlaG/FlaF family flagellin (archaellin)